MNDLPERALYVARYIIPILLAVLSACRKPPYIHPSIIAMRTTVVDVNNGHLEGVDVMARTPDGRELHATFDETYRFYRFDTTIAQGTLHISRPGYEPQTLPLKPERAQGIVNVYLGMPGDVLSVSAEVLTRIRLDAY